MRQTFGILLILFCAAEVLIILGIRKRNRRMALSATVVPFILFLFFLVFIGVFSLAVPYYALILLILTLFFQSYFGYYLDYFGRSKLFDRWLHAFGTFSHALLFYHLLGNFFDYGISKALHALLILLLGISLGAVYEVIEFWVDSTSGTRHQKGLTDTDFDILCDIAGAFLACALANAFLL